MSESRLVIHAGFHKSGTTALQESFDSQSLEFQILEEKLIIGLPGLYLKGCVAGIRKAVRKLQRKNGLV